MYVRSLMENLSLFSWHSASRCVTSLRHSKTETLIFDPTSNRFFDDVYRVNAHALFQMGDLRAESGIRMKSSLDLRGERKGRQFSVKRIRDAINTLVNP